MNHAEPARVAVARTGSRTHVTRLAPSAHIRPRVLRVDGSHATVTLLAACASLLAGDDLRLEVDVGAHAGLELVEPSGTVAYNTRGGRAGWTATIRVAEGGHLTWKGGPFVVTHGADVRRHTDIDLAPGATLLLRETLVLGRSHEDGGRLRATLTANHGGKPLLVEDLDLTDSGLRSAPGALGERRVLATVTLLGAIPDGPAEPHETMLAGPGAHRREITAHAHEAEFAVAATWMRWRNLVDRETREPTAGAS